jgi:holo-[acyl-carrier protein] synthase
MQYIGTDIIEISRIEKAIERWGDRFLQRIYTNREIKLYQKHPSSLAARFAAKEAVIKALDASNQGVSLRDIEIISSPNGKPLVRLHGSARKLATKLGITDLAVSLSHSRDNAIAVAIAELPVH